MYYNARYYDPQIGQFISPDTIVPDPMNVLDYNRYLYTYGNPIKYNDPSGHCALICGGLLIAVAVMLSADSQMSPEEIARTAKSSQFAAEVVFGEINDPVTVITGYDHLAEEHVPYGSPEWTVSAAAAAVPGVSGAAARKAVALGKEWNLVRFASSKNAYHYREWRDNIISPREYFDYMKKHGPAGFFSFDFPTAMNNATEIHFSLDVLWDDLSTALQKGSQGNGVTNQELYTILTNPAEWWKKTTFYKPDGTEVKAETLMEYLPE